MRCIEEAPKPFDADLFSQRRFNSNLNNEKPAKTKAFVGCVHVVCSWLGNSPRIAQQSYLLVTEDDFAKAAGVAKVMLEGLVPCVISSKHHHRQGH